MDDENPFSNGKHKEGNFRKRSRSHPDNGKRKRQNSSHDHNFMTSKPVETIYRILCPVKKIGSVLGKGGDIVNALRDETHAKIRVADAIPGAEERVIIIFSYLSQQSGELNSDEDPDDVNFTESESQDMMPHCPAQDALLKVHDRIAADEVLRGGVVHEKTGADDVVTSRILVPSNQVGCLLGKGGTVIQKLRSDTGANIRILPAEHLPPCAMSTDELVQISGVPSIVKKALYDITTLLHQHPRKENPPLEDLIYASTHGLYQSSASMPPLPQGNPLWSQQHPAVDAAPPMPWIRGYRNEPSGYAPGNFSSGRAENEGETAEFSIRILCATVKIGGVIGKGGVNVRQLEQQTGAHIQVEDTAPEAEERVIVISSKEVFWDPISPTIEALLQLQSRTSASSEKGVITTRLLVPSSKVGCILGQGGDIITEMRRRTRADIRVYSKDDKPKYTSANEELVQISGNQSVAREALSEIASRLRARTLRGGNAATNTAPPAPFRGFPPSESLSSRGPPPTVNSSINPARTVPFHGFAPLEGFSGRGLPSPGMVGSGSAVNYDHPKGSGMLHEAHGYPGPRNATGYPTMNSSLDVKIPSSAVASVRGSGASNFSDIRQISGARVKLHDPLSGASECVVEIHSSSDQMKAAHSLHQFIASGGQNVPPPQAPRPY
ncbi:KH domain-containing protein At4g18375 isoform X2 [Elaeis guineensis]|uniref:KH domain-containing protein HEN4 n=2 Tax=Elaeis guineensis var. tenera TaxID=51953 RepID=A0A6I9QWB1_ELAGV|nr:KH domain-containing protein HEN4 [Elaeis guineensis]